MPDPTPPHDPSASCPTKEQPERTLNVADGAQTYTQTKKGNYNTLLSLAQTYVIGTTSITIGSGQTALVLPLTSWNLTRLNAGLGLLRETYGKEETNDSTGEATVLSTKWSMKHTQRLVSLMVVTGASASMPKCGNLLAWRREPDPVLYDAFQYHNQAGAVLTLSSSGSPSEQAVAAKVQKGVDSAMRFYPTVQRIRLYTRGKLSRTTGTGEQAVTTEQVGAKLAHIDTPGSPWDNDVTFGNPPTPAVWLKIGDDVAVNDDGTQTRTESWIGAKSWDADLYGPDGTRWENLD